MTARYPERLLLLGLILGWAFDLLFYGKIPGASVAIYGVLLLVALFLALRWQRAGLRRSNLWMPALFLFFVAMVMVRANGVLIFLNIVSALLLLVLMAGNLAWRPAWAMRVHELIFEPIRVFVMSVASSMNLLRHVNHPFRQGDDNKYVRAVPGILKGLLISIPILLLLVPLLISADMVFAERMRALFSWDKLFEWSFRIVLMAIIGVLAAGGLVFATQREESGADAAVDAESGSESGSGITFRLGIIETIIPINFVNLLFLFFMGVQIPYLFGGDLNISEQKFTYAEYARRGFAELIVVAVLIFGMILLLQALGRPQRPGARLAFNLSATLLLLLTVVLLVSAFKRLALYESVYGFTTMRIYPHLFMIWLGVLLLWFVGTLWFAPERLAAGLLVAGFGFVISLNLLNPDAFVVQRNLARYYEFGAFAAEDDWRSVDTDYFKQLSEDAVPSLLKSLVALGSGRYDVETDLRHRYLNMEQDKSWQKWQSWNLSRWRTYHLLHAYFNGD